NLNRTLHSFDCTGEFRQNAVTGSAYHSASVLVDERVCHCPVSMQSEKGSSFILTHESTVPSNVGAENGGELPFHIYCSPVISAQASGLCHQRTGTLSKDGGMASPAVRDYPARKGPMSNDLSLMAYGLW